MPKKKSAPKKKTKRTKKAVPLVERLSRAHEDGHRAAGEHLLPMLKSLSEKPSTTAVDAYNEACAYFGVEPQVDTQA